MTTMKSKLITSSLENTILVVRVELHNSLEEELKLKLYLEKSKDMSLDELEKRLSK
jgi:hypothetical protein